MRAPRPCPSCGFTIGGRWGLTFDDPAVGDLLICDTCFEICVVTPLGSLRIFALDDLAFYDFDQVAYAVDALAHWQLVVRTH